MTTRIALIALGAGLSFLIPVFRSSAGIERGTTWTGIIFIVIAIVLFVGARSGAGAEVGLRSRGATAAAEVLEIRNERRKRRGRLEDFWVARVRYRDQTGALHEGDIDDCSEEEREKLQPGRFITVKYDPEHPDTFVWID